MYEELMQRAKALDERATPGPWMWDMRTAVHTCKLVTTHSGRYYVMQFSRWGMQDACPEFQQFKKYSGPVTERGGLGMVRADKMARSYPGKEHHKGFDDYIDHPDAVFIAESRALVTKLIEAVTALQAENAEKGGRIASLEAERDALVKARGEGLLLKTLCKVGEIVYYVLPDFGEYLGFFVSEPHRVTEIGTRGFWTSAIPDDEPDAMSDFTPWSDFGKTVFLTRAEAEAALNGGVQT